MQEGRARVVGGAMLVMDLVRLVQFWPECVLASRQPEIEVHAGFIFYCLSKAYNYDAHVF